MSVNMNTQHTHARCTSSSSRCFGSVFLSKHSSPQHRTGLKQPQQQQQQKQQQHVQRRRPALTASSAISMAVLSEPDLTEVGTLLTSLPDEVTITNPLLLAGFVAVLGSIAVILVAKLVLYSQMELIAAAMMTRHVPGPRVIQLVSFISFRIVDFVLHLSG